jgi:DNA polymerase-1
MSAISGKKLVVVDGMAYAFRAFYAIPEMTNTKGQATNAVQGFAGALRRAEREFHPEAAVVAFDSPGGSFRDEMLKEYKAHREAPPESLVSQFPLIEKLAVLLGWGVVRKTGFEADDLIATLCRQGRSAGYEVVLMTSDKDILQLVGDGVRVYRENPKGPARLYGPEEVRERYGVGPELIGDLLGLMGDASDNIPGVPGVGEKTAAKLLLAHGSLEGALKAAPDIKGKLGESLRNFAEQARLSRRVAALREDVDLGIAADDWKLKRPDWAALEPFLKELELRSLLEDQRRRLGEEVPKTDAVAPAIPAQTTSGEVKAPDSAPPKIRKRKAALKLGAQAGGRELEAAGLDRSKPCGVALAAVSESGFRMVLAQAGGAGVLEAAPASLVRTVLGALDRPVLFQAKGLERALFADGWAPLKGVLDVALASWLLDSRREPRDLGEAAALLGLDVDLPPPQGELFEPGEEELRLQAEALSVVGAALEKRLRAEGLDALYDGLEAPLVAVLADMEEAGIHLDSAELGALDAQAEAEMDALRRRATEIAGREFNLNSPAQLAEILFGELKLEARRKTKTGYSTDNEVLEALAVEHPLPGVLLDYRQLAKLSGTYLKALPRLAGADGRVHTTWNQCATATGRLSSTEPNLQNIPVRTPLGKRIRKAFTPQDSRDAILAADYSQVELRILAHYSGDPVLKQAFLEGRDIHTETAARLNRVEASAVTSEMRSRAKVINFGVLYGMGAYRISRECALSLKEAKTFLEDYFGQFPTVRDFLERTKREAHERGYAETLLKRRRAIPELASANRNLREQGERIATNLPIQGTAADLMKRAMLDVHSVLQKRKARTRMLLQVHDELVFELAHEEAQELPPIIQKTMENAMKLTIPLAVEVGVGRSWGDAKK